MEKRRNCNIFNISNFRSQITYSYVKSDCLIYFILSSANLMCRGTDISNYFRESLGLQDNESRLYMYFTVTCIILSWAMSKCILRTYLYIYAVWLGPSYLILKSTVIILKFCPLTYLTNSIWKHIWHIYIENEIQEKNKDGIEFEIACHLPWIDKKQRPWSDCSCGTWSVEYVLSSLFALCNCLPYTLYRMPI